MRGGSLNEMLQSRAAATRLSCGRVLGPGLIDPGPSSLDSANDVGVGAARWAGVHPIGLVIGLSLTPALVVIDRRNPGWQRERDEGDEW